MKRRTFFGSTAATAGMVTGLAGATAPGTADSAASTVLDADGKLAGMTLEQLRDELRYWLFDDFLPFMDSFVIDWELGGFMCTVDRDGTRINSTKTTWYEGRGIWVYSYLYNHIEQNPSYLETARKSVEFISRQNPLDGELMPASYTKEGRPLVNAPDSLFYGNMFVAAGFQEFSRTPGNERYWDMARQMVRTCVDIYDNRPGYGETSLPVGYVDRSRPTAGEGSTVHGGTVERPRITGHWMVLLNCAQMMLQDRADPELELLAERSVEAVMEYHYHPAYGLINEYLKHDLSRIENDRWGQICIGHGLETLWMVLHEAVRHEDLALFNRAAEYLRRSIEVFWDEVYDGLLAGLHHVDRYSWDVDQKSEWLQVEVLTGLLMVIEHTGATWAKEWFGRLYRYVMDKFPLRQYGFPLWIAYADRNITFTRHYNRCEHFHHPRYLMQGMLAIDRMIASGGRISGVFS